MCWSKASSPFYLTSIFTGWTEGRQTMWSLIAVFVMIRTRGNEIYPCHTILHIIWIWCYVSLTFSPVHLTWDLMFSGLLYCLYPRPRTATLQNQIFKTFNTSWCANIKKDFSPFFKLWYQCDLSNLNLFYFDIWKTNKICIITRQKNRSNIEN